MFRDMTHLAKGWKYIMPSFLATYIGINFLGLGLHDLSAFTNLCILYVYRFIPFVSELAQARPDTGAVFVFIRHPTDCISV